METSLQRKIKELKLDELGIKTTLEKVCENKNVFGPNTKSSPFIWLLKTRVAGTSYIDDRSIFDKLFEGQALTLKRDRQNQFDDNAIMVQTEHSEKIGFIPKEDNSVICNLLDAGKILVAEIVSIDDHGRFFDIEIDVSMVEE